MCSLADRGQQKSLTAVLHANRDIPAGIVMSGTEEGDPYFSKFVPTPSFTTTGTPTSSSS